MDQMGPADWLIKVEVLKSELGHESKRQRIEVSLSPKVHFSRLCHFWIISSKLAFQIAVKNQEASGHHN